MTTASHIVTADELDHFPDDGKRREVIGGGLHVSTTPPRVHQELVTYLANFLFQAIVDSGAGMVFAAPVDVRFSSLDQVQPDLIAIRSDRLNIYTGHTVHGAPDIVVEILSPSNRSYDEVEKRQLYASGGVPEYWIVDPEKRQLTILNLTDDRYEPAPIEDTRVRSTAIADFEIDIAALFAKVSRD